MFIITESSTGQHCSRKTTPTFWSEDTSICLKLEDPEELLFICVILSYLINLFKNSNKPIAC